MIDSLFLLSLLVFFAISDPENVTSGLFIKTFIRTSAETYYLASAIYAGMYQTPRTLSEMFIGF